MLYDLVSFCLLKASVPLPNLAITWQDISCIIQLSNTLLPFHLETKSTCFPLPLLPSSFRRPWFLVIEHTVEATHLAQFDSARDTNPCCTCSPLKKHRNVTAGVARLIDTDTPSFGNRRVDDSHDVSCFILSETSTISMTSVSHHHPPVTADKHFDQKFLHEFLEVVLG